MNAKKKLKLKDIKNATFSSPLEFQHKYHMGYSKEESTYTGLPPQWRKRFACLSSANDINAEEKNSFFVVEKPIPGKRTRIDLAFSEEDDIYDRDEISKIDPEKIFLENPINKLGNIFSKTQKNNAAIFFGFKKNDSTLYFFKCYSIPKIQSSEALKNELKFVTKFSHENIMPFVEAYLWENLALIVFLDEDDISLNHIIASVIVAEGNSNVSDPAGVTSARPAIERNFTREFVVRVLADVLSGLKFIHEKKFIHRDIRSDNILVSSEGIVKISDFGACVPCNKSVCGNVGTPYWMAPEVAANASYGTPADIWSIGCVVVEFADGQPPFYSLKENSMLEFLRTVKCSQMIPFNIESKFGDRVIPFLKLCFAIKPIDRGFAGMLLSHPFLLDPMERSEFRDTAQKCSAL